MIRIYLTLAATLATISLARADEAECVTIAKAQSEITALGGGPLKMISREELLFARGLFAGTPPVSPYPKGEYAMIAMFADGQSTVVFIDGDKSCSRMGVEPRLTKLLLEIDKSI